MVQVCCYSPTRARCTTLSISQPRGYIRKETTQAFEQWNMISMSPRPTRKRNSKFAVSTTLRQTDINLTISLIKENQENSPSILFRTIWGCFQGRRIGWRVAADSWTHRLCRSKTTGMRMNHYTLRNMLQISKTLTVQVTLLKTLFCQNLFRP